MPETTYTTAHVATAVFPVAGLGTRFLPATKASPKEMLTVVDKPLIQYAVEEAYAAGIRHMVFVTGRSKRAIEDHFDTAYELESELERTGKQAMLAVVRAVAPDDMNCSYVRQPRSLGLGHAVLCAAHIVGRQPFAVLLADDLMTGPEGGQGVLAQMVQAFTQLGRSVLAVQEVPAAVLQRMIQELPDGYRTVFNLFVFEKKSHREIAGLLGIRQDSSASQYFRARAYLARQVKAYLKEHER